MKRILLLCILFSFSIVSRLEAQSCFNIFAGNDTTISCLQSCLNLHAKVPDVRSSDDYQAISIPYQPYPFTNPGGILVDPSYLDDRFSPVIPLPFTFCFYGQTYNSCVVGTNGVVTFDLTNAGLENGYILSQPIPFAGGIQGSDNYYPKASIMGAYHDIDPSPATPQQPDKKMEYIIVGASPCRKFILNFYKIPYYFCGAALVTQQIVMYEGTGIIDVFFKDKPFACGASTNGGTAILGVQNLTRDRAVWVAGRNNTVWSAFNEGWRFVPNGGTSLLNRVELYKNGTLISTATNTTLGNGQVDALFTNVCQSEDSMSYVVRAFYQKCDNPAIETEGSDTMIVYKTLNPLTVNTTATSCPTSPDGHITVTNPVGANIEYSIDNGVTWQSSPVFNVISGNYTVIARVVASTCKGTTSVTVDAGSTVLTASLNPTATSCPALSDGTITVTPGTGTAPYLYSLDGGANQSSNVFTNVATGAHNVTITDANGCVGSFPVTVAQGPPLPSMINGFDPPCSNVNNGTITVTPTSGTGPYQYRLNAGAPQASNIFSGLPPGVYTVDFTDANGCTGTNNVTLTTNPAITATSTLADPLCNGTASGSITINATGGVPSYQYSNNGGATYQASSTFNGLIAGTYTIRVKDAAGCLYDFTYTLTDPPVLSVSSTSTIATCNGNDGTITITAGGGTPAYAYSINGGTNYAATNIFNNLVSGNYNIKVKDANGCTTSGTENISLNDTMRLDLGPDSTICFGSSITLLPQTNAQTDTFRWTPRISLNYDTAKNPIATPNDTTKYYLHAKWGVCVRDDSVTINVLHKPVPHAGNDTLICYKSYAILSGYASNTSGPVSYAWAPAATVVPPTLPLAIATPDTTQQYVLTVTDNYGCNFSVNDSMWVNMEAPVPAFAGNDTNALLGKPHHMKATGGVSYLWSPGAPLNDSTLQKPTAILFVDTYFRVWVTDAIGCKAFDDIFIKVYEGPNYYVPNAFTPNGDGLNDIFRPIPVGMKSTDYFMVFDRYGEPLFQTREWLKGWDGRFKGKDAPPGTYVWIIRGHDENNQLREIKGTVVLIR